MLDLDPSRTGVLARDAATVVALRDGAGGLEVFCVERHANASFLAGAIVFPGGTVDDADRRPEWTSFATELHPRARCLAPDSELARFVAIAACREMLEEAALLPVSGDALDDAEILAWRARLDSPGALFDLIRASGRKLDVGALHPLTRWITPTAEKRRYDTRFFVTRAPRGQTGAHDHRETSASFWVRPAELLARFRDGRSMLFPPTHRTLEWLCASSTADEAIARTADACLDPICPKVVRQKDGDGETIALTLPGDPEHDVREVRSAGHPRFVLRGTRWMPELAPTTRHE